MVFFFSFLQIVLLLAFASAQITAAELVDEDLPATQVYEEDSSQSTTVDAETISFEELQQDLSSPTSARYQIKANLTFSSLHQKRLEEILTYRTIVIGSGRNTAKLRFTQTIPTYLRDLDISIDRNQSLCPHYVVEDAFLLDRSLHEIPHHSVMIIFAAHVGNCFLPIERKDQFLTSLRIYRDKLLENGLFIYNSEVHKNQADTMSILTKNKSLDTFEQIIKITTDIFVEAGFVNVEFLLKKEEEKFFKDAFSFLVIAEKPQHD